MIEFFKQGGFGMWGILLVGVILLGASLRFAVRPDRGQYGLLVVLGAAVLVATVHATWTDFGAVFAYLSDAHRAANADVSRVLFEGLKESTRPGAFGGGILTLALLFGAAGVARLPPQLANAA